MPSRKRLALLFAFVAGCNSPGVLVSQHEPGTPVGLRRVPVAGTYGLFIAGEDEPQLRYPLSAGERIGFDDVATTQPTNRMQIEWLYAVAGPYRRPLDFRQTYQWRRLDEGQ